MKGLEPKNEFARSGEIHQRARQAARQAARHQQMWYQDEMLHKEAKPSLRKRAIQFAIFFTVLMTGILLQLFAG